MKQASHLFFLFLFLSLLFSNSTSALLLPPNQGDQKIKAEGIAHAGSSEEITDDFSNLMGMEECEEKDEDCLNRRMVEEAHLDYIYTQHHNKHKHKP